MTSLLFLSESEQWTQRSFTTCSPFDKMTIAYPFRFVFIPLYHVWFIRSSLEICEQLPKQNSLSNAFRWSVKPTISQEPSIRIPLISISVSSAERLDFSYHYRENFPKTMNLFWETANDSPCQLLRSHIPNPNILESTCYLIILVYVTNEMTSLEKKTRNSGLNTIP